MAFEFYETEIEGLYRIFPHVFRDERGVYKKYFEKSIFKDKGINIVFNESSDLVSCKGALRGLHYQTMSSQAKLIHVVAGAIFDVALDLRKDSKTFGKYHAELLSADSSIGVFIPEGFAHGFISLYDNTIFSYQCTGEYIPMYCGGIRWDDPELSIKWPLAEYDISTIIATEKDKNWPILAEYKITKGII